MKTIAVTLVHDKKDNAQQIIDLLDKLEPQYMDAIMDGPDSDPVQLFTGYKFKDIKEDHEVKVYQFVPQGVGVCIACSRPSSSSDRINTVVSTVCLILNKNTITRNNSNIINRLFPSHDICMW